jgi:hypothetical protein
MPPPDDPTTPEQRLAELERREAILQTDRVRFELGQALSAAHCRPDALQDALAVMASGAQPDFDADGRLSKLTLGGADYATPAEAASAFLSSRPYLLAEPTSASAPSSPSPSANSPRPEQTVVDAWARPQPASRPPAPQAPQARRSPNAPLTELLEKGYSPGDLAAEGWAQPPK